MSDQGRFLFYASEPSILASPQFGQQCPVATEKTATILGCYAAQRIYVYDVTNSELDGIKDVTAAHEMLHAAYDRLSGPERQRVDTLVENEYATLKKDPNFAARVKLYDSIEPGQRDNELHSIIGTEIATISPELENYYRRYFKDRSKVTTLQQRYSSVFTQLQNQSAELIKYLNNLSDTIGTEESDYNTRVAALNAEITVFNRLANAGEISPAQFTARRKALVLESDALEVLRTTINTQLADYEAKKAELMSISAHVDQLNRSVDSKLAPAPTL